VPVESLSDALRRLTASGFHHAFRVEHGKLRDLATGEAYDPEVLEIDEIVRFEGESDPDEQAVLFALRSPRGNPLGTYSTVFGPGLPPDEGEVIRRLGAKS
jgi:hypothetical protein